jgi:hypothetical protein
MRRAVSYHFEMTTRASLLIAMFISVPLLAQPALTSWRLNTTGATGTYTLQNGVTGTLTADVQQVQYDATSVYVSASGIPSYAIGPFPGNPSVPAEQHYVAAFPRTPVDAATPVATVLGAVGLYVNGVGMYNADDGNSWSNTTHSESMQGDHVWHRNAGTVEAVGVDACEGHPQQQGAYHHHEYSPCLGLQLGATTTSHSPLLGFAFDGYPVYGPYGYTSPLDASSGIRRMASSYRLRSITQRHTLPDGTVLQPSQYGPDVDSTYFLSRYLQDFEYVSGLGDLDEHNGRFCVTPDYPEGTYAYFVTLDDEGGAAYPYSIGPTFRGTPNAANFRGPHVTIPSTGVTTLQVLSISAFAPAEGGAGTTVVISGKGFSGAAGVRFGEVAATSFTVDSDTQITAVVPSGAATGRVRVDRSDAYVRSTTDFSVHATPRRRAAAH